MDIDVLSRKMHQLHLAEKYYEGLTKHGTNGLAPEEAGMFRSSYTWAVNMIHNLRDDMECYASESGVYDSRHYIY
jgi:hypothetical protein